MNIISEHVYKRPTEISSLKWWFLWQKRYFEIGYGSMFGSGGKLLVTIFGVATAVQNHILSTFLIGGSFGFYCWVVGIIWVKFRFAEGESEISNRLNWFIKEMRDMKEKVEK